MPSAGSLRAILITLALLAPSFAQAQQPEQPKYPTEVGGKSLSQWLVLLKDNDPSVREDAIRAVVLFGPVTGDTLSIMLERLVDFDAGPRSTAVTAFCICDLKKEDFKYVVEALTKRLNYNPDDRNREPQAAIRLLAALALSRFGEDARSAIPALVDSTRDPSSFEIRRAAVRAITSASYVKGGPADIRGYAAVVERLGDKEPAAAVRMEAIVCLGYLGKCSDQKLQQAVEQRLIAIARGSDRVMGIMATVSLMMIEHPVEQLIADVGKDVKHKDLSVRLTAIRAVGIMGSRAKQFVPDLIAGLSDKEPMVIFQCCMSLAAMGKEGMPAVAALKELSERKDTDERLKQAAKFALEQINKPAKP
jgi:HEAT repeat protein